MFGQYSVYFGDGPNQTLKGFSGGHNNDLGLRLQGLRGGDHHGFGHRLFRFRSHLILNLILDAFYWFTFP